jgi:hypothetical protein
MMDNPRIFEQKGHPTIKLFDDKISIKAIDYSNFRDFTLDKVKELKFYRPFDNSFFGLLYSVSPVWRKFRENDNYVLRIKLKDGEHWDYETTSNFDQAFVNFVKMIQIKVSNENLSE